MVDNSVGHRGHGLERDVRIRTPQSQLGRPIWQFLSGYGPRTNRPTAEAATKRPVGRGGLS